MFSKSYRLLVVALLVCGAFTVPAFSQGRNTFSPQGASGPHPNGGTGNRYAEDLCKNFVSKICMIAGVHAYSRGLGAWPVIVQNSRGLNVEYTTNTRNSRGWIVVIGAVGSSHSFIAKPGRWAPRHNNNINCQFFDPGTVVVRPNVAYGTRRYYYKAVAGGYCFY